MDNKNAIDDGIDIQVEAAKQLVLSSGEVMPEGRLERLEHDIRAAFARATAIDNTETYDRERRIARFMGRKRWDQARREDPSITLIEHVRNTYPDRHAYGMLRGDLNDERVDPKLYRAIYNWAATRRNGSRNELPDDLGLPTMREATDAVLRSDEAARAGNTMSMLNASDARIVRARNALSSREHKKRQETEPRLP